MRRQVNFQQVRRSWWRRRLLYVPDHVIRRVPARSAGDVLSRVGTGPGGIVQSPAGLQRTAPASVTPANGRRYRYSLAGVVRAILGVIIVIEIVLLVVGLVVY